jgi:hypothetical protein
MLSSDDSFAAIGVDRYPIDTELTDDGTVGPELAHLALHYVRSPRALVWRNPSSEWRLLIVLLPLTSRLSLMVNPIFAQLARAWGLNLRFIGIDRDQLIYDFRSLLSDRSIKALVQTLAANVAPTAPAADDAMAPTLDVLFAALAGELLTVIDRRRDDWGKHLLRDQVLEPQRSGTLFDRDSRFPDFLGKLREALRNEIIDVDFYGKALRSIDLREGVVEQRLAGMIEAALDPITMAKLARSESGKHLGCYNWLRIDRHHAAARSHILNRLPALASFFAEAMLTLETLQVHGGDQDDDERDTLDDGAAARSVRQVPTLDLRGLAARSQTTHSLRCSAVLKRAIDSGQDRAVIEAIAQRFAVSDNVIRRLWRESPKALGTPPTWQLARILRLLNELPERQWPSRDTEWHNLITHAVPAEAT